MFECVCECLCVRLCTCVCTTCVYVSYIKSLYMFVLRLPVRGCICEFAQRVPVFRHTLY